MKNKQKNDAAKADVNSHQNNIKKLRKYQEQIGMTVCVIGAMAADSEPLLIPISIVLIGTIIIRKAMY